MELINRTLKSRIGTDLTAHQNRHYLEILLMILDADNKAYHPSIGRAPTQVSKKHETANCVRLYGDGENETGPEISEATKVTLVWISQVKGPFEKGYLHNWS